MPRFTAIRRLSFPALVLVTVLSLSASGCVKKTIRVDPQPVNSQFLRKATFDELISIIREYDRINALSSNNLDLTFTSGKNRDKGVLERYRTLHGYILLKKPESVRMVLQIPITNSRLFDFASVGDNFYVDYPRENQFYRGKNSAKDLVAENPDESKEFNIPIRGTHIFEAIFPQSIRMEAPGTWISMEECNDARTSYYVLSIGKEDRAPRMHIVRRIWFERSGLTIARQQVFSDRGQIVSEISYSGHSRISGFALPLRIHVDRPLDGYILDLEFKSWRVNPPDLSDDAFVLQPPADSRVIDLKDRGAAGSTE